MRVLDTELEGVIIIEPDAFSDKRGFFMETYHERIYMNAGIESKFVQDNLSYSLKGTLRGLHYQFPHSQAKLVQVIEGEVFDVSVDIRRGSPTLGQWTGARLSHENKRQMYIPQGFAHGFCVLSESALFFYKCSDFYAPDEDRGILWSDPQIGIEWPVSNPSLSPKDSRQPCLKDIPESQLPAFRG